MTLYQLLIDSSILPTHRQSGSNNDNSLQGSSIGELETVSLISHKQLRRRQYNPSLSMKKLSPGETDFLKTAQLHVANVGPDPELHHCVWQMSSTFDWLNLSFQGKFHLKLFWAFKHLKTTALGERIFGWVPDDWNSHLGLMGGHLPFTEPQFPYLWSGATQSTSNVRLMNALPQQCSELSHPLETRRLWLSPKWSHSEFHNNESRGDC